MAKRDWTILKGLTTALRRAAAQVAELEQSTEKRQGRMWQMCTCSWRNSNKREAHYTLWGAWYKIWWSKLWQSCGKQVLLPCVCHLFVIVSLSLARTVAHAPYLHSKELQLCMHIGSTCDACRCLTIVSLNLWNKVIKAHRRVFSASESDSWQKDNRDHFSWEPQGSPAARFERLERIKPIEAERMADFAQLKIHRSQDRPSGWTVAKSKISFHTLVLSLSILWSILWLGAVDVQSPMVKALSTASLFWL